MQDKDPKSKEAGFQRAASPYIIAAGLEVITFPLNSVKTLVQVGHEPLPVFEAKSWFGWGKKTYWRPSLWTYADHIRKTDGIGGLFRGLSPKICQGLVQQAVAHHVGQLLPPVKPVAKNDYGPVAQEIINFCRETTRASVIRSAAVLAGHPFEVISVRMIVFCVGRERPYASFLGTVGEIYRTNGWLGFFAGIAPRLTCEIASLWGFVMISRLIMSSIGTPGTQEDRREMEAYVRSIAQYVIRMVTYPFMLTSTLMIVDGSGMQAAEGIPFDGHGSWLTCLRSLYRRGLLMRGSNLLRRYVTPDAVV